MKNGVLKLDSCCGKDRVRDRQDYTLKKNAYGVWITVDGISIWVRRGEVKGSVLAQLFKKGREASHEALSSAVWWPDNAKKKSV